MSCGRAEAQISALQKAALAELTWALLLDHLWQIPLVDEQNQTSSSEQQEEPEGTGQPPSPSTQGVHHYLPLHPQHDAAQSDANVISSGGNQRRNGYRREEGEREREGKKGGRKRGVFHQRGIIWEVKQWTAGGKIHYILHIYSHVSHIYTALYSKYYSFLTPLLLSDNLIY